MKKSILLISTMMVISAGFLSGCEETTSNGDTIDFSDKVELVNYTVETFGADRGTKPEKIGDGFIHNDQANNGYYKITGTIRNDAGRMLKNVTVKVDFYDINDTYLGSESDYIFNLTDAGTGNFKVICLCFSDYFESVDQIEFDISAIQ